MFSARATSLRTTSYKSNCIEHINMAEVDEVEHEVPFRDGKPPLPVKVSYTRNVSNTPNVQGELLEWSHCVHEKGTAAVSMQRQTLHCPPLLHSATALG